LRGEKRRRRTFPPRITGKKGERVGGKKGRGGGFRRWNRKKKGKKIIARAFTTQFIRSEREEGKGLKEKRGESVLEFCRYAGSNGKGEKSEERRESPARSCSSSTRTFTCKEGRKKKWGEEEEKERYSLPLDQLSEFYRANGKGRKKRSWRGAGEKKKREQKYLGRSLSCGGGKGKEAQREGTKRKSSRTTGPHSCLLNFRREKRKTGGRGWGERKKKNGGTNVQ